jgi:hypothetical protein
MLTLLLATALAGSNATTANAKIPPQYRDRITFAQVRLLEEMVSAVVPSTWKEQSAPKGVFEPAEGDEMFSPTAEFRIAWLCGDGCKPVDDWAPILEERLFKEARGWTWKVDREEKSATQRFLTAHAPNGTVEITRVLFKAGEPRALYCKARLVPYGGSILAHDPAVDRMVASFEEACLALAR